MKRALLDELRVARAGGRPVALLTSLDGGEQHLCTVADAPSGLVEVVARALATDTAEVAGQVLVEPQLPRPRLIVIGAVHIAEPLAQMAALTGFSVSIVDPRRSWATMARFPGQDLVTAWPDVALRELGLDARTAVVTLTHDPKLDDPALVVALASPAFYIGCLGSQKTHAARRARLLEAGVEAAALDRLHGPVGLRIGASSPAEIAVSILAEIVAALRGGNPESRGRR